MNRLNFVKISCNLILKDSIVNDRPDLVISYWDHLIWDRPIWDRPVWDRPGLDCFRKIPSTQTVQFETVQFENASLRPSNLRPSNLRPPIMRPSNLRPSSFRKTFYNSFLFHDRPVLSLSFFNLLYVQNDRLVLLVLTVHFTWRSISSEWIMDPELIRCVVGVVIRWCMYYMQDVRFWAIRKDMIYT